MCGHHEHDHAHHHTGPQLRTLTANSPQSRRKFLGDFGKRSLAMAVITPAVLAACGSDGTTASTTTTTGAPSADGSSSTTSTTAAANGGEQGETTSPTTQIEQASEELVWARANLGFVSAYVFARGNSAAIVDTGVAGSAEAIGMTLADIGLNYNDVDHVILTHRHGDHAGSTGEVMDMAVNATVYAGEADLFGIDYDDITGLVGGEDVFGFEMLHTPGHTVGHISVIDHEVGILVAGDTMWANDDGSVSEGPGQFFDDVAESQETIRNLAALSYNTLLVGHGEPIMSGADAAVGALAATLS